MREIKFRAWDITYKKMYDVRGLNLENNRPAFFYGETHCLTRKQKNNSSWILRQFTGVQDLSGLDIYEGDIILVSKVEDNFVYSIDESEDIKVGDVGEVFYASCHFALKMDLHIPDLSDLLSDQRVMNCEVIGNIYENPELLDKNP